LSLIIAPGFTSGGFFMGTHHLSKSEPGRLAFRFSTLGATLQAAQAFAVHYDVQFGEAVYARVRAGEGGTLATPEGSWVPGAQFSVLVQRDGALLAVPAAEVDYYLGLVIGGFTVGADGHPDPATAWDLASGPVHRQPTVRPALADRDYPADRDAARALCRGEAPYPRLVVMADCWVRIDGPDAPLVIVSTTQAERLCGVEAA
jgi:hypothetical protein